MERAPTAPLDPSWGLGTGADSLAATSPNPGKARRRVNGGVRVEQLAEYPVRTLVFEAGDSLQEVSAGGGLSWWAVGLRANSWQHGGGEGEGSSLAPVSCCKVGSTPPATDVRSLLHPHHCSWPSLWAPPASA